MTLIKGPKTYGLMLMHKHGSSHTVCKCMHNSFVHYCVKSSDVCEHYCECTVHVMLPLPIVASIRGGVGAGRGRLQGHERRHCVFPCASRAFSDVTGPTQALSDGREKNVCC